MTIAIKEELLREYSSQVGCFYLSPVRGGTPRTENPVLFVEVLAFLPETLGMQMSSMSAFVKECIRTGSEGTELWPVHGQ